MIKLIVILYYMKKPTFLLATILLSLACFSQESDKTLSSFEQAKQHPIVHEGPAPDFFEGALIGNGGLGAVVCTRPDAVVIRFGHNNVWDIRIAEDNKEEMHNHCQQIVDRYQTGTTSYRVKITKAQILIDYKANYKGYELKQVEAQKTEIYKEGKLVLKIGATLMIGELAVDEILAKQRYDDVFSEEHGETMRYTEEEKDLIQKHAN